MRVALVSNMLPPTGRGGAEAYAAAEARALAGQHDVLVVSGAPSFEADGVTHVSVSHQAPVDPDAGATGKALWHLRDQWRPAAHREIAAALRAFRPDVVHTHQPQGLSAAVFTAVAQVGVPHVHTAHDFNLMCLRTSMTRDGQFCGGHCRDCRIQRLVRGAAVRRHLKYLLGVSQYVTDRHLRAGIATAEQARTLRLGAEPGTARLRRPAPGTIRLGFIGTLAPHKGVLTLLRVFADAPDSWSLEVAGAGPLLAQVQEAAAADARITALGHTVDDDKDAFFDRLDLLVIPSEWEEPAAFGGFEAGMRGLPVLAADRGGLPELPEVVTFPSGDAAALREAVARIASAPDELEARSRRLLDARDELSWARHMERLERFLEDAAGVPHAGTDPVMRLAAST